MYIIWNVSLEGDHDVWSIDQKTLRKPLVEFDSPWWLTHVERKEPRGKQVTNHEQLVRSRPMNSPTTTTGAILSIRLENL